MNIQYLKVKMFVAAKRQRTEMVLEQMLMSIIGKRRKVFPHKNLHEKNKENIEK